MDLEKTIQELRENLRQLAQVIAALEERFRSSSNTAEPKRRGRKFMTATERQKLSERMKKYWSDRRWSA